MLLNKLIRSVVCSFFLIPTVTYAKVSINIDSKDLRDYSAYIEFSGEEAKDLWKYLDKINNGNGFVLQDSEMGGKSHLTSPVITCRKASDHPPLKDSSFSYDCRIKIDYQGLPITPY